jgi:23S rRNA (guanosine2251-2'-O)-methyltransferase
MAALDNPERKILRLVATAENAGTFESRTTQVLAREDLDRLLPAGALHQGLALLAHKLPERHIEDVIAQAEIRQTATVIVLDQVSDPHNVGAVLRSAAAFGALAVIVPERHSPELSGTVAKAASGAVEHVPLIAVVNLARCLEQLKRTGFWVAGLAGDADKTLASLRLSGKVALVLGSEGEGLRRLTRESCDLIARLPTSGPVASLNVSNAAAIALYELVRDQP